MKWPPHLCKEENPHVAFQAFLSGSNSLASPEVSVEQEVVTSNSAKVRIIAPDSFEFMKSVYDVFERALPQFFSYGFLMDFMPQEKFQKKLETCPLEVLIAKQDKTFRENGIALNIEGKIHRLNVTPIDPAVVWDFFERVAPHELAAIEEQLCLVDYCEEDLAALRNREFSHPIFQTQWDLVALKAFTENALDLDTLSALLILYEANRSFSSESIHHYRITSDRDVFLAGVSHYLKTEEQKSDFFNLVETLPAHYLHFFVLDRQFSNPDSVLCELHDFFRFRLLFQWHDETRASQTVLSPILVYTLLLARHGRDAMKPIPILGNPVPDDLKHSDQRVIQIPCRHISQKSACPLDHYQSNYYDLWLDSANYHRKMWIHIAEYFEQHQLGVEALQTRKFFAYSSKSFCMKYLNKPFSTPEESFWLTVLQIQKMSKNERFFPMIVECIQKSRKLFKAWGIIDKPPAYIGRFLNC